MHKEIIHFGIFSIPEECNMFGKHMVPCCGSSCSPQYFFLNIIIYQLFFDLIHVLIQTEYHPLVPCFLLIRTIQLCPHIGHNSFISSPQNLTWQLNNLQQFKHQILWLEKLWVGHCKCFLQADFLALTFLQRPCSIQVHNLQFICPMHSRFQHNVHNEDITFKI